MVEVLVLHDDLTGGGGAQAVCLHTIAALQEGHDVTLLTLSEGDLTELNEYFGTAVSIDEITVSIPRLVGLLQNARTGARLSLLKAAYLTRAARNYDPDLYISTMNELPLTPCLHYVHHPRFHRERHPDTIGQESWMYGVYDAVCKRFSGFSDEIVRSGRILANSEWTAAVVERIYGVDPSVVYPPVDSTAFSGLEWSRRENGFVTVGRVTPDKNVIENIRAIGQVRERAADAHIHLVGPLGSGHYAEQVRSLSDSLDFVELEGQVSRSRLVHLLGCHRYGLHGKVNEHFGIVVAEMVAAGMIPFVHRSGGQQEIVNNCGPLLYSDMGELQGKLNRVMDDPEIQVSIRETLSGTEERFDAAAFRSAIRSQVGQVLEEQSRKPS